MWKATIVAAGLSLVILALGSGCAHRGHPTAGPLEWQAWKARRTESIAGENGWATLVGLCWLSEGPSTLGSAPDGTFVLSPQLAPPRVGTFSRHGDSVRFQVASGISATFDGKSSEEWILQSDGNGATPTMVSSGHLRFFLIVRGGRLAIRIKSPNAAARVHFRGLEFHPYQTQWCLAGHFEPASPGTTVRITDVTGGDKAESTAGIVSFTIQDRSYHLLALDDEETHDLWLVFRDGTAGKTTHRGGRFLHVAKPGSDGNVVVDFNYAYNPPCAFTAFATCPLPPDENRLDVSIPAGELKYRGESE